MQASNEAFKQASQASTEAFKQALQADTEAFKQATQAGTEAFKQATQADTEAFKRGTQATLDRMDDRIEASDRRMEAMIEQMKADTEAFKRGTQATLNCMDARFEASGRRMEAVNERAKADAAVFDQKMEERFKRFAEERREMNRKWGDLANKMGTLVEDLVFPSLPRVVDELLRQPLVFKGMRVESFLPNGRTKEYDAVLVTTEVVCVNNTKSTLRGENVNEFIKDLDQFREFFPQYRDYPLIGILASLHVEPAVLDYAEKTGFVVLATGDDLMDIMNSPGFVSKRW